MAKMILLGLAAITLSACSGGGSGGGAAAETPPAVSAPYSNDPSTMPGAIAQAEKAGVIPVLDVGTSIAGTDADDNGVRDDIDAYINALSDTPAQKAALRQKSAALNAAMVVDVTDSIALAAAAAKIRNAASCTVSRFSGGIANAHSDEIKKYTINTPQRFDAWMKFNQAMSGSVTQMPKPGVGCAQ